MGTQSKDNLVGSSISHYDVTGPIGAGGMGEVYEADDKTLKRKVAIKAIRAGRRLNARAQARFLREARALSQLDHPHICRIYDYIKEDDGDFLVLELIGGRPLDTAIEVSLDPALKYRIAEQLASALVAAHAAGVVHRDLKPSNVMLTEEDQVKVLDFGLARSDHLESTGLTPDREALEVDTILSDEEMGLLGEAATTPPVPAAVEPEPLTRQGDVLGTLSYMSPEQARGEPATSASDMYSFGLILHELFTGDYPYPLRAPLDRFAAAVRSARTRPITDLEPDLAAFIGSLESLAPSKRPTAVDAVAALARIRDRPRRRRRRLALVAGLMVLTLAGVKYTVDLSRERSVAVAATEDAERRRVQAEGLIEFMLGDLRKKLDGVGRLDIMDDVGDQALEYFAVIPGANLSDEELFRRTNALILIGDVRFDQGDLPAALLAFEEALTSAKDLAELDPDNGDWQVGLGAAHFWVAQILKRQRKLDLALEHYQAYLDIARALVAKDPKNPEWQLELGYAHTNVGLVLEQRGDFEGALIELRKTLEIEQSSVRSNPTDMARQHDLCTSHAHIGRVLEKLGRLDEAQRHMRAQLEIRQSLVALDADNTMWQSRLATNHQYLGRLLQSRGLLDEAEQHFESDIEIRRRLTERDPANRRWQRELAASERLYGLWFLADGAYARAGSSFRSSIAVLESLVASDGTNNDWKEELAASHIALADSLVRQGQTREAGIALETADTLHRQLSGGDPESPRVRRDRGRAELIKGRLHRAEGRHAMAAAAFGAAIERTAPLEGEGVETAALAVRAMALLELAHADAEAVVNELAARGYRSADFVALAEKIGFQVSTIR